MTAEEVACYLLHTCKTLYKFESFMFGSSLHGIGSDFDILVIAPSDANLSCLKSELKFAGQILPLDILFMLPEEAQATNFIIKYGCISLYELSIS